MMHTFLRRRFFQSALAALPLPVFQAPPPRGPAGDRFWIFATPPGGDDEYLELAGLRGGSRMTAMEGAAYLGVPNMVFVRVNGVPRLPGMERWRARTTYEQYAIAFRPLERVVWSVVGSGGRAEPSETAAVLDLAKKFPNIHGVYLDDFFVRDGKKLKGVLSPEELRRLRARLALPGKRLEMWLTLYTTQFDSSHPQYLPTDVPLKSYLDLFDTVLMWTWNSDELTALERNFSRLQEIRPRGNGLGLYLWDFHGEKPVPLPLMEKQCKLGLQWLKKGRIDCMVFLANTVMDVGLEAVEWTRNWIRSVAREPLG